MQFQSNTKQQRRRRQKRTARIEKLNARNLLAGDLFEIPPNISTGQPSEIVEVGEVVYFSENGDLRRVLDDHSASEVVDESASAIEGLHTIGSKVIYRRGHDIFVYDPSSNASPLNLSDGKGGIRNTRDLVGNGTLSFFTGRDPDTNDYWTWSTDGTVDGTVQLVKHDGTVSADHLHAYSDGLIFAFNDGVHGEEPWISDGTPSGTKMLRDIRPGRGSSSPEQFTGDDDVFFTAKSSNHTRNSSRELYITDGMGPGTRLISKINDNSSAIDNDVPMVIAGNYVYFAAREASHHGSELWRSDGTQSGTKKVLELIPDLEGPNPRELVAANDYVYFNTDQGIYVTQGTESTTNLLAQHDKVTSNTVNYGVSIGSDAWYRIKNGDKDQIWEFSPESGQPLTLIGRDGIEPHTLTAIGNRIYFGGKPGSAGKFYVLDSSESSLAVDATNLSIDESSADDVEVTISRKGGLTVESWTVLITNSDPSLITVPRSVTIPAGFTSTTLSVSPIDNDQVNGSRSATLRLQSPNQSTTEVVVTVVDDDKGGVRFFSTSNLTTTEEGDDDSFQVRLASEPSDTVTIEFSSSNKGEVADPSVVNFTPSDWNVIKDVLVAGVDDSIDDGDHSIELTVSVRSDDPTYADLPDEKFSITNVDNDTAALIVEQLDDLQTSENEVQTHFNVKLGSQPTNDVVIGFSTSDESEVLAPEAITLSAENWDQFQQVTLVGVDDDVLDGDQLTSIRLSTLSSDATYHELELSPIDVTNLDDEVPIDPVISWAAPEPLVFGDALSEVQLNAKSDVEGTFTYSPDSGVILDAGNQQELSVSFTPSNRTNYNSVEASVLIDVQLADPTVQWSTPDDLLHGVLLSDAQLNATSNVEGNFTYTPQSGTALTPGEHSLQVRFTPDDKENYNAVDASVNVNVIAAMNDFGDAPGRYPVSLKDDGARHATGTLTLGSDIDAEHDGNPADSASGDGSDDDGVVFLTSLLTDPTEVARGSLTIHASAAGKLDAWIDFDTNESWDPNEQVFDSVDVVEGENLLSFDVPSAASIGSTYARFRLSTHGDLEPTGEAADGEVEDYLIDIKTSESVEANVQWLEPTVITVDFSASGVFVKTEARELFRGPAQKLETLQLIATDGDDQVKIDSTDGKLPPNGIQFRAGEGIDELIFNGTGLALDSSSLGNSTGVDIIDLSGSGPNRISLDEFDINKLPDAGHALRLRMNHDDSIATSADTSSNTDNTFLIEGVGSEGSEFYVIASSDNASVEISGFEWTNPLLNVDVNLSGRAEAIDALLIINELGRRRFLVDASRLLDPAEVSSQFPMHFYDTSGDLQLSAFDALLVINALARSNSDSNGEAEIVVRQVRDSHLRSERKPSRSIDAVETTQRKRSTAEFRSLQNDVTHFADLPEPNHHEPPQVASYAETVDEAMVWLLEDNFGKVAVV